MPDPSTLLRIIAGEFVYGLNVDSQIRKASNCMSARLLIELFNRCDDSKPNWQVAFAESLSEFVQGDPSVLIGFDDGRWQGKENDDESELSSVPETEFTYLKLTFRDENAAYYQFPLFPTMDQSFVTGGARKREGRFQHVRVELARPDYLQLFIEGLRVNPHLISVEESSEEVFSAAPSHPV